MRNKDLDYSKNQVYKRTLGFGSIFVSYRTTYFAELHQSTSIIYVSCFSIREKRLHNKMGNCKLYHGYNLKDVKLGTCPHIAPLYMWFVTSSQLVVWGRLLSHTRVQLVATIMCSIQYAKWTGYVKEQETCGVHLLVGLSTTIKLTLHNGMKSTNLVI